MKTIYYSHSFPSNVAIEKILGYKKEDFQKALDSLFFLLDTFSNERIFQKPLNIVVAKTNSKLILSMNTSKAILGFNSIAEIPGTLDENNAEQIIRKTVIRELGFDIELILKIDLVFFKNNFDYFVSQFNQNQFDPKKVYTFSSEMEEYIQKLEKQVKYYNLILGGNGMWVNPIFKAKDITVDPKMCFCVLPFNETRLRLLEKIIKPELEKQLGINVIKSGDIFQPNQNIMESIWTYINQAAFIIADISDKNPNVFYELGICHTIGKKVITLCDQESYEKDYNKKLPFDISSLNTIFYKKDLDGPQELVNKLIDYIKLMRPEESHLND